MYVLEEYSFPFRLKDVIITEANMEGELKASMVALRGALLDTCVRFLHQLLNKLIQLIVYPPVISGQIGEWAVRDIFHFCFGRFEVAFWRHG